LSLLCPSFAWLWRAVAALGIVVALVGIASPAGAHAELTASSPASGETVGEPVEHIALEFSNPVVAVDEQFELLDAAGQPVAIASIEPDGETTSMHVTPAAPLTGGTFGLQWAARAGDTHPRVGSITFTVDAPAAVAPEATPGSTDEPEVAGAPEERSAEPSSTHAAGLHEALEPPDTGAASTLASVARFFIFAGLLLAIGGIVYLALVHRGTRDESRRLVYLVRRAALLVIAATLFELPVQAILVGGSTDAIADPGAYSTLLEGDFGIGVLLRIAGAVLVFVGLRMQVHRVAAPADLPDADEPTIGHDDLWGGGGVATKTRVEPALHSHRVRIERSPLALIGVIALVCSELFIGHTASTEPRWLVVVSGAIHLLAGGLWVAGVAMLAATLWRRHRRGAELEAALLATRFSVAAIAAVAAVSFTGVALGIAILGDVGALTSTEFGRLLLVKVLLVIVLVALGAYNQRVVMPALERRRRARRGGHRLRRVVTAEVVVFLAVIAVTAALVGADSTG
jgi:copper transport protein